MTDAGATAAIDRPVEGRGEPLLRVTDAVKHFPVRRGVIFKREIGRVQAVDGVSLEVYEGETVGIVGESGCGKSTLARSIMRLHDLTSGTIEFQGRDITHLSRGDMRPIRRDMQMVFQDPYASLNPRRRVGSIVGEAWEIHKTPGDSKKRVQELLERVGLNPEHYNRYPHEFSGGQRQRIGIARALALEPRLIVCDEPVSALDVSVQAQILNLLEDLQNDFKLTYIFIAHDLDVVRHVSDRVLVMYLGKIVEQGTSAEVYQHPRHPYSASLLSASPVPDPKRARERRQIVLEGDVPSPLNPPTGCRFHTRCPRAQGVCASEVPPVYEFEPGHTALCHFPVREWPLPDPQDIRRPDPPDAAAHRIVDAVPVGAVA
jgi:oligopeptide transport system ATP-binding protein